MRNKNKIPTLLPTLTNKSKSSRIGCQERNLYKKEKLAIEEIIKTNTTLQKFTYTKSGMEFIEKRKLMLNK